MHQGITVGIDLGDRQSDVCELDGNGQVVRRHRVAMKERQLTKVFQRQTPLRIVLEVGTHSPWVSRLLERLGHEVIVANPRKVRLISQSDDKHDQIDAELLARLGRVDPSLLRPIRHRGEQAQRDRALLGVRDGLVRARVRLVNQARGQAKALGTRLPSCTTEGFAARLRKEELTCLYPGLEILVEQADQLTQQIRKLDRRIEALCKARYPETELLRQVTGVGALTALAFVLTLEDPLRFRSSRQVGAYVGLRPKRRQSGNSDPELRITKSGDPYLRQLLMQSAHYILGPFGPDTDLRRFGERLGARGGRIASKKARVAVARKLAVLLHRLWRTAEVYEPLRNTQAAEAA